MKPKSSLCSFLIFAGSSLLCITYSHAAPLYWDGSTPAGAPGGGSGIWDNLTTTNWDTSLAGLDAAWNNSLLDTAVYGGTAGTVTLGDDITVGGLTFNTTGYTVTGVTNTKTLTFGAADNTILLNNIAAATIAGSVAGSGNVLLTSSNAATVGTLNFTGATAGGWSGTTTIGANLTVTLDGAASLNRNLLNTSGITLNGGAIGSGTLANNANASADRINDAANWTVNSGSFTWGSSNAGGTYAETLGTVTLNRGQMNFTLGGNLSSGSQTLTLGGLSPAGSSAVTFSNSAVALNGSVVSGSDVIRVNGITSGTAAGEIIAPWATVGSAAIAQTDYAKYTSDGTYGYVVAANIAGSAQTTWTAAANAYTTSTGGAVTLTGTRTITALRNTGATTVLTLAGGSNLETYGLLNGVTTLLTVAPGTGGVLTTPNGGGNLYLNSGSGGITLSAPIINNGGDVTVVQNGSGTLTLSSTTSNYSGGTVLNAGTLATTADTNLGTGGGVTVNGNATWNMGSNVALTYNRSLTVNEGAILNFASGNAVKVITGVLSGSGTLVNPTTTGITFSNTGNMFTGTVNNGYQMSFTSLGDSSNAINLLGSNSEFIWNGVAKTFALRPITLQAAGTGNITQNGSGALVMEQNLAVTGAAGARTLSLRGTNTNNNTFAGNIADDTDGGTSVVSVAKSGAGTWILSGNNSYTGGTTLSGGILKATAANALGAGNMTVSSGTLVIDAANAIADTASLLLPSASTKNLTMNANDTVGSLFLAGAQQPNGSYSFGTNAAAWMNTSSGILMVGSAAAQPIFWDLDGATPGAGGATPAGTWDAGNAFWNALSDGSGVVATWSPGATAVFAAGTNATGTYTVNVAGTQDIGGLTFEEGNVTLSGGTALRLVSDSLAHVATGLTATISTPLTQDASARALSKGGLGTLVLSSENSFSGATTVNAGTLRLTHTESIALSSSLNLSNGAALHLRSDTTATFANTVTKPTGTVNINVDNNGSGSGNTLTLGGTIAYVNSATSQINITGSNGYDLAIPAMYLNSAASANTFTLNPTTANVNIGAISANTGTTNPSGFGAAPSAQNIGLVLGGTGTTNTIASITDIAQVAQELKITKNTNATWSLGNVDVNQGNNHTVSAGLLNLNGVFRINNVNRVFIVSGPGVLGYNNAGAFNFTSATTKLVMAGGSLDNNSGAAITTSTYNPGMTWTGDWTFIGTNGADSDLNFGTGAITMAATRQVTVTNSETNLTLNGAIAATTAGLTKAGAGTLTLGGANLYTGATTVNNGRLLINGSTSTSSAVTVNVGTLGGTGTIGGSVSVLGGATLSPGASIESLKTGALTMASGSNFAYEVADNSPTGADLLGVNGALSLTGVNLNFDLATAAALAGGSWAAGDKLTLISYSGSGITTGFVGYTDDASYNFGANVWTFNYNDTEAGGNYAADAIAAGQTNFVTLTAFTVIPEPSSVALLGTLGAMLLLRRRR